MIIINIRRLLKKIGGRPPVCQISELILIGYGTSAVGGGGKSTLGITPQKPNTGPTSPPMTSVSTCLLFMTPGRSKGTRQEDAFTLCLWAASLLWWDGKISGVSGTPSAARPDSNRECVGQRHRAIQRGSPKGEICQSNGHFYGLGEFGCGLFEAPSSSNQSDDSRESSIVPKWTTDVSFFPPQQAGFKWLVGGAAAAWGYCTPKSISSLFPFGQMGQWIDDRNN